MKTTSHLIATQHNCEDNVKIENATLKALEIPFKVSFKHASANRSKTESILVEMHSSNGLVGYGESCPRTYVTGESIESVKRFFSTHIESFKSEVFDLESAPRWLHAHTKTIDENPAAMCAIEMAFIDLLAKENRKSVEGILGVPELHGNYQYTAVLGDSGIKTFRAILDRYVQMGFSDFKVKLSGDIKRDTEKCAVLNCQLSDTARIRFDANNIWDNYKKAVQYLNQLEINYFAVEEPLKPNQYEELQRMSSEINKPIILDESFLRAQQMEYLLGEASHWLVNVRISKMGGILRSKAIVDQAREQGIHLIIGAQVGETSLLTRAALTVANYCKDILVAQEGAFGNLLLEHDICDSPLMFGKYGELHVATIPLEGYGLGINVVN